MNQVFDPNLKFSANDAIRFASTFHSMHAIAGKLTPSLALPKSATPGAAPLAHLTNKGITKMQTSLFTLYCYQSYTGLKFIVATKPGAKEVKSKLITVYKKYSDYVCKNAYQQIDMPIRSLLFDQEIEKLF